MAPKKTLSFSDQLMAATAPPTQPQTLSVEEIARMAAIDSGNPIALVNMLSGMMQGYLGSMASRADADALASLTVALSNAKEAGFDPAITKRIEAQLKDHLGEMEHLHEVE